MIKDKMFKIMSDPKKLTVLDSLKIPDQEHDLNRKNYLLHKCIKLFSPCYGNAFFSNSRRCDSNILIIIPKIFYMLPTGIYNDLAKDNINYINLRYIIVL